MESANLGTYIQFILSALVSALTIGGKAISKEIAKKYSTRIIGGITKIVHFD